MYHTCMFGMVGVMVCMKKIMAVFMQVGEGTVFCVFVFMSMVVGMKIVIMLPIGILIMVVAMAMGNSMVMSMITVVDMTMLFRPATIEARGTVGPGEDKKVDRDPIARSIP